MNIKPLGANMTELEIESSKKILFSYRTPVAAYVNGEYIRTSTKWSCTTTKHINKWLGGFPAKMVDQSTIDDLVK